MCIFRCETLSLHHENAIGLFSRLGCRLRGFGDDARTREIIGRACRENGWFTPADIRRAVAAVAGVMLRRDALAEWLAPYPVPVAEPRRVLVVMAGNIPLVGFSICCACSPQGTGAS